MQKLAISPPTKGEIARKGVSKCQTHHQAKDTKKAFQNAKHTIKPKKTQTNQNAKHIQKKHLKMPNKLLSQTHTKMPKNRGQAENTVA